MNGFHEVTDRLPMGPSLFPHAKDIGSMACNSVTLPGRSSHVRQRTPNGGESSRVQVVPRRPISFLVNSFQNAASIPSKRRPGEATLADAANGISSLTEYSEYP
jgi:hypothetical protein